MTYREPMTWGWRRRARRLAEVSGQTTTEYLMIAGLFAAIAAFLLGVLPYGMRTYAGGLITSVRTIAP